jgi:hypothetical protein
VRCCTDRRATFRSALHTLRRSPLFTSVAPLTLSVGMMLAVSVSAVLNAYLVHPLPYPDADRLVFVRRPGALDWRERVSPLRHVVAWDLDALSVVRGDGEPERVWTSCVTPGFLDALGIRPVLGRTIRPDEAEVFTIAGVVPPDFWYFNRFVEVLAPLRGPRAVSMTLLEPGVSADDAQRILADLARERSGRNLEVLVAPAPARRPGRGGDRAVAVAADRRRTHEPDAGPAGGLSRQRPWRCRSAATRSTCSITRSRLPLQILAICSSV